MELEGKRILITGANRGLGRALALACAEAGAGDKLTPLRLDVTSDEDVSAASASWRVDVLVTNAGVAVYGGVLKAGMEEIRREIETNYLGALRMARAFAPAMVEDR